MRTTRIYGLFILIPLLLIGCSGGGGSGSTSPVGNFEISISPGTDSAELQWQNPSIADNQGIYQFTIEYEVVPNLNQQTKRIYESHIHQALRALNVVETAINDIASETLTSISQSRIWDWDEDEIGADTDNCLHIANPSQEDADRDGIGDACDESNAALRFIPGDRQVTISWPNPVSDMTVESFVLTISPTRGGRTRNIVVNQDDPGFSSSSVSWYIYEADNNANYDVQLQAIYQNSNNNRVALTAEDSPTKHPYQASVRLGPNLDGDELADREDPDRDNDGIVDDEDEDDSVSALEGTHLLAYEGNTDNLALYFNANQPVSYNLTGLAPDSHYTISVTAHIHTYHSSEFAASLGYDEDGNPIPDSVDTSKQERSFRVLDGSNTLIFVTTDTYTDPDPFIPIVLSHVGIDRLTPFIPINSDLDRDGVDSSIDLDTDGDGLIELRTQDELNAIRYVLNGTGFRSSDTSEIDQTGCQNCHGYELVNDIVLTDYSSGEGWQPLGGDEDTNISNGCQGSGFSGVFDGNGHTISRLRINRPQALCVGLFGEVEDGAIIRSLRVQADRINGLHGVGILIGVDRGSNIIDASASMTTNQAITGHNFTGGLVGEAYDTRIQDSAVTFGDMNGEVYVGGMVGRGTNITIHDSSVAFNDIDGTRLVGGMVGYSRDGSITDSTVSGRDISNTGQHTGGLAGGLWKTTITNADVTINDIIGKNDVGGLMGYGVRSRVTNSHIKAGDIMGNDWVGGLIAGGAHSRVVGSSSNFDLLSGNNRVGGLIGMGTSSSIHSSMVSGDTIEGDQLVGGLIGSGDNANVDSSSSNFIDLMGRNFLGGLIGSGASLVIRNSTASSHSIVGTGLYNNNIGGLIGHSERSRITSSHADTVYIEGNHSIGGLIGNGIQDSVLFSSAIVDGPILGNSSVGGLIGDGLLTIVRYSYAMVNSLKAETINVGGLIGNGRHTITIASFAITGSIKGDDYIGGIVGESKGSQIIASYAVMNTSDTTSAVGGLAGKSSRVRQTHRGKTTLEDNPVIKHSYVVGGSDSFTNLTISGSIGGNDKVYYDKTTLGKDTSDSNAKTTDELQDPDGFSGTIYQNWENKNVTIAKNDVSLPAPDSKLSILCDDNFNGNINSGDTTLVWNLGSSDDYPTINCTPLSAADQHKAWSVEEGEILLNFPSSQ